MMIDRETIGPREQATSPPGQVRLLRSRRSSRLDMKASRGLDKALFQKLAAGDWIDRHQN